MTSEVSSMRSLILAAAGMLGIAQAAACADLPKRIVMMWQVTGKNYAADFRELKGMGVNVAQSFALADMDPAYVDGFFREAEAAGIGVVPFIGKFIEGEDATCALSAAGEAFVRAHAGKSALLAWHTVDEPVNDRQTKACQRRVYKQVKSLDPKHAVMVSINFTKQEEYDQYFDERAFDILDLHRYPNPDIGPAQQRLIDMYRANRSRDNYRVIVTLRAFDAPRKVMRLNMRTGDLDSQYDYFFRQKRITDDIGFYGWRLAPNLGISQLGELKLEFGRLSKEKLATAPNE
jgi:hypothetical protein